MDLYRKAEQSMFAEIINIMSLSFNQPTYILKFFFEKRLNIDNCYVCLVDGKVVSVLNVIQHKLKIERETINGIYIYGACTLREYRSLGYMSRLLQYVHDIYRRKGYECSFLLPESTYLESFYKKLGYKNLFKLRRVELNKKEILNICGDKTSNSEDINETDLDFYEIEKLRENVYKSQNRVIYNENDIEFAHSLYKSFSFGDIIRTNQGYAICSSLEPGIIKIRDFTCQDSDTVELLNKIYNRFPNNKKYIIETSVNNRFFENLGQPHFYGMIYPISELCDALVNNIIGYNDDTQYPYLGISLE